MYVPALPCPLEGRRFFTEKLRELEYNANTTPGMKMSHVL
jgi:hypothetical protein